MRRARGFTFVEMMVVIVLLGVVATLAFPRLGFMFKSGRIESAAREIQGTLRQARSFAIASGEGTQVVLDPETARFYMEAVKLDAEGNPLDPRENRETRSQARERKRAEEEGAFAVAGEATRARVLPDSVFFTLLHSTAPTTEDELPRIVFHPDGSATTANIGIQDDENQALAIRVYRTTGMVKIEKGEPVLPPDAVPLYIGAERTSYEGYR